MTVTLNEYVLYRGVDGLLSVNVTVTTCVSAVFDVNIYLPDTVNEPKFIDYKVGLSYLSTSLIGGSVSK